MDQGQRTMTKPQRFVMFWLWCVATASVLLVNLGLWWAPVVAVVVAFFMGRWQKTA